MTRWGRGRIHLLLLLVLVAVNAAFYARAVWFDFVNYDEMRHVINNEAIRSLSPQAIWGFFTDSSGPSYYPIRTLSFAIDYALWELWPGGYHLSNAILHTISTCLLYLLLVRAVRRLTREAEEELEIAAPAAPTERRTALAAGLGAGLFALHPVVVEPVAWVSGREELLMVLFGLLCLHFHQTARQMENARREQGGRAWRGWLWHGLTGLAFVLACLSNAVGAVIAALVLMYDLVIERICSVKRLITGNLPLWAIAVGVVLLKLSHQDVRPPGEAVRHLLTHMSVVERLYTALALYALNWWTVVCPRGLILVYPNLLVYSFFVPYTLAGALLVLLTLFVLWLLRRRPIALAGMLWFLLALGPSAQILPHHIFRANRFLYLPMAGLAWMMTAAVLGLARRARWRMSAGIVGAGLFVALGLLTWRQIGYWRDTISLFTHTIEFNTFDAQPYNVRGAAYADAGWNDLALRDLNRAVEMEPADAGYLNNRARVLADIGKTQEAIADYSEVIRLQLKDEEAFKKRAINHLSEGRGNQAVVDFGQAASLQLKDASVYYNRGNAYMKVGQVDAAIADFGEAIQIQPDHAEALNNRGSAYVKKGNLERAVADFEKAIHINPKYARAYYNLGAAQARSKHYDQAVASLDRALELDPTYAEARLSRARALTALGRHDQARQEYVTILAKEPTDVIAIRERGHACAALGDQEEAMKLYTQAIELKDDDADLRNRRGVFLAQSGRLERALEDFNRAIKIDPNDPAGYANRAFAHDRMQQWAEALADWEKAIELDPNGPVGAKGRRGLQQAMRHLSTRPAQPAGNNP